MKTIGILLLSGFLGIGIYSNTYDGTIQVKSTISLEKVFLKKQEVILKNYTNDSSSLKEEKTNIIVIAENRKESFHNETQDFFPLDENIEVDSVKYTVDNQKYTEADIRSTIVEKAKKHLGTRYVWGGKKPGGFDCSGFTSYMLSLYGVHVSPSSRHQGVQGERIELQNAAPGDLVFFSKNGKNGRISHVAMVVENTGDKLFVIHACNRGIVIDNILNSNYWTHKIVYARNIINPENVKIETTNENKKEKSVQLDYENIESLISDMEGFNAVPAICNKRYAVGYGRAVSGKQINYYRKNPVTREVALKMLQEDFDKKRKQIEELFKNINLNKYQIDALASIAYTTGFYVFKEKEIVKDILKGKTITEEDFVNTLIASVRKKYRGLIKRRKLEYAFYSKQISN